MNRTSILSVLPVSLVSAFVLATQSAVAGGTEASPCDMPVQITNPDGSISTSSENCEHTNTPGDGDGYWVSDSGSCGDIGGVSCGPKGKTVRE